MYGYICLSAALVMLLASFASTQGGKLVYCKVRTNYEEMYRKNETAVPIPLAQRKYKTMDPPAPCALALTSDAVKQDGDEFQSLLARQLWNRPKYEFVIAEIPELEELRIMRGLPNHRYWDCLYYQVMFYALKHYGPLQGRRFKGQHLRGGSSVQPLVDTAGPGEDADANAYTGPTMAWLDFGVFEAWSVNVTATALAHQNLSHAVTVHGFDTWEGLPEDWDGHMNAGTFSLKGVLPPVRAGVQLHKGFFNETLPRWLQANPSTPIYGVSVDCDLYNGSMDVLMLLGPRLQRGSILHFHELRHKEEGGPTMDEARALRDWLRTMPHTFRLRLVPIQDSRVVEPAVFIVTHL